VEKVETYLTKVYGVSIKFSLVKALKSLNRSANLGKQEHYKLPTNKREITRFRRMLKIADGGKLFRSLVDSTEQHMRLNGTIGDIGNKEVTKKNRALNQFLNKLNHQDILSFQLTGTAHLLDKNMAYLAQSLILGLSFSILLVALVMGMVYQSFSMLLISLIPNLIPLLAIGALMGFMGIELKTSTSIIFTIAFGIAVDDTIHLLGRFKLELSKGRSKIVAMKNAYQTTGKAMVITTFILCSGFFLLVFSDYMGAFYMGLLISVTLFVALIADLTLLPILIVLFYHPKKPN
jgi:predicted RND superfamily exporter protein